ncbi:thymidylate kinase [Gynaephora ruoergensis nucleopolyhedrovirus]|nr:thymidylate kinase [Gynaephora ruoergensis nucleopolyhedrovirus]
MKCIKEQRRAMVRQGFTSFKTTAKMSYLISLGGVACTTKTTILSKLKGKLNDIEIHSEDYKELNDEYQFDPRTGGMMFASYRCLNDERYRKDYGKVHVFDRHPMEALVYATLHQKANDADTLKQFEICRKMKLCENWKMFVLSPSLECVSRVTEMMIKRNNGLDVYSNEYVFDQIKRFEKWLKVMGGEKIEIDSCLDLDEQQNKIIKIIQSHVYRWSFDFFDQGFATYFYKAPVLKRKIAMFDAGKITIDSETTTAVIDRRRLNLKKNVTRTFTNLLDKDYTIVLLTDCFMNCDNGNREEHVNKVQVERSCDILNLPVIMMCFVVKNNKFVIAKKALNFLNNMEPSIDNQNSFYCDDVDEIINFFESDTLPGCKFVHLL